MRLLPERKIISTCFSKRVFLVGAFLVKSARHFQWLVFFFVRLQSHSDWATFFTIETTKTTSIRGQVRSAEISAKGSPFHFLFFYRNLQNRTRLKGSIFFRHCATFFENFLMSQKSPLSSFLIFCNRIYVNKAQRVPPFTFFGTMRHFLKEKKSKISSFFLKKVFCAF